MQKFVLPTFFCLSAVLPSFAQTDFTERPATFRLSSETIKLPGDEKMGLIGGSYLIETLPGIYLVKEKPEQNTSAEMSGC